jgi:hypothetical protein
MAHTALPITTTVFALAACALLGACEDQPTQSPQEPVDRLTYWEQQATDVAVKTAGFELGCSQVAAETIDRNDAVMVKWYSIGVTGCGKKVLYQVTCANKQCSAERKSTIEADPNRSQFPPRLRHPMRPRPSTSLRRRRSDRGRETTIPTAS